MTRGGRSCNTPDFAIRHSSFRIPPMSPILHLFDQNADYATRRMAVTVAEGLRGEFAPTGLTIGRGGDLRDCLTAARCLESLAQSSVVHAWGTRPLIAASLAGCEPIIYSPPADLGRWDKRWLRWLGRRRDVRIVFSSEAQQRDARGCGLPEERTSLIRPGIQVEPAARDSSLRRRLGFSDDDFVVLAAGESTRSAGHKLAVWTTAILHVLDETWKLLVWGRGDQAGKIARLAASQECASLLRLEPSMEFEQLLAAADVVLSPTTGADAPLAVAMCMAAGIP